VDEFSTDEIQMSVLDRVDPVTHNQIGIGAVARHHRTYDRSGKYVKLTCTSDSGAGESVLPKNWFPEVECKKSEEHNTSYAAADGTLLPNEGKKTLTGLTTSGKKMRMDWQLADITKPLASVSRLCERGHRVVFDDAEEGGGFIEHKTTGARTALRKSRGVYEFDVWVKLPETPTQTGGSSFRRQG
jgi:hypothetical protein